MIAQYKNYHSPENFKSKARVPVMDIYLVDNRMFMICEIPIEQNFVEAWNSIGKLEIQDDWGKTNVKIQQALPGHKLEWIKWNRYTKLPI